MKNIVQTLVLITVFALTSASAHAQQVRSNDEMFSDLGLLFDILTAVFEGTNVDDPQALAEAFPNRQFSDFDRDRDGEFMTMAGGFGLFDLNLAILQFNHDRFDADNDGVLGFYELECSYAPSGKSLNPTTTETDNGIQDGSVDCDGDGSSNAVEIALDFDPLDPNSAPDIDSGNPSGDGYELINATIGEAPMVMATDDGYELTLQPSKTVKFEGDGYTLEGTFGQ